MTISAKTKRKFWARVKRTPSHRDGCWVWTGCTMKSGYGVLSVNGANIPAHRFSFILRHGKVPKGKKVCHHCDNRVCVRPTHLFAGTDKDNLDDCMAKGRHKGPPLKYSMALMNRIRYTFIPFKHSAPRLAKELKIPLSAVKRIIYGTYRKRWSSK